MIVKLRLDGYKINKKLRDEEVSLKLRASQIKITIIHKGLICLLLFPQAGRLCYD